MENAADHEEVDPGRGQLRQDGVVVLLLHVLELLARQIEPVHLQVRLQHQRSALEVIRLVQRLQHRLVAAFVEVDVAGDQQQRGVLRVHRARQQLVQPCHHLIPAMTNKTGL